MNLYIKLIL